MSVLLENTRIAQILLSSGAQVNPKCEPFPLVQAMINKHDDMVELLLQNGAAADVSLTGPNSIWIPAIESGHPPNLMKLQHTLGGTFDEMIFDGKTHLSLAIDFRAREVIEWLLKQPEVTPSVDEVKLIKILSHLISIDKVIEDANNLYERFSDPSTKNFEKKEGFKCALENLQEVDFKYSQLSMFLGLTYLEHLVNQLHTLILKIQGIYDRYYNSDLSKGLSL